MKRLVDDLLNDCREMVHLQLMLLPGYFFGRIRRKKGYPELSYDVTAITNGAHIVNCHTRFFLTCSLYSFMHMMAPHAFAPIFGQQRRMNIDNPAGKSLNKIVGHKRKKACQDNEINMMTFKQRHQYAGICQG